MSVDAPAGAVAGRPSSRGRIGSTIAILAGTVLCLLPAAFFGTALGTYPNRMVCTTETGYGSGCYEGELMLSGLAFGFVFLFCAAFCFALTMAYRDNLPKWRKWLPFEVFAGVVLMTVAALAFTVGTTSGQYL